MRDLDAGRRALRTLKREAITVWHVARDARTPGWVRGLALAVAAYAFSPIDLIPDAIPVLGLLDDLLLVPAGVWLVLRCAPEAVVADARARAQGGADRPVSRAGAVMIVLAWLAVLALLGWWWPGRAG